MRKIPLATTIVNSLMDPGIRGAVHHHQTGQNRIGSAVSRWISNTSQVRSTDNTRTSGNPIKHSNIEPDHRV
jgi:hypothetical protein